MNLSWLSGSKGGGGGGTKLTIFLLKGALLGGGNISFIKDGLGASFGGGGIKSFSVGSESKIISGFLFLVTTIIK